MKREEAKDFFNLVKYRDIEKSRKISVILMVCLSAMMFLITITALLFAYSVAIKPTPVIAFDKQGKRVVFSGNDILDNETNRVRIHRFLTEFIGKFEGVSPDIENNLKDAYNMLTPKFRQILLDKSVHSEKIDLWKNRNFETTFALTRLKILKGDFKAGSALTVEGIGEMDFHNAVDYSGDGETRRDYLWFSALLIVTPISLELSPDGLFVEFYAGRNFPDKRQLRAFLSENKKDYLLNDGNEVFE